jgi:hypothetical protein
VQCPLEIINLHPSRDVAVLDFSYKFGNDMVHKLNLNVIFLILKSILLLCSSTLDRVDHVLLRLARKQMQVEEIKHRAKAFTWLIFFKKINK